ncbi:Ankyrin repeats (3 copies) [Carpediemonas membranifera]|uniref:Ankyrin repeats (3 copies) n=1 Tax=Carpediemonas membranifera TaxID=201153 RepID=A0A8J6B4N8_9EUKA|nr:Ankyrin repeats (3 copies) [Carpediemonas membranifera]|eukprot:KAG9394249.1 Ankyrin repeats (3 copies) [Carpediemonas membranifera]
MKATIGVIEANKALRDLIRNPETSIVSFHTKLAELLRRRDNSAAFIGKHNTKGMDLLGSAIIHNRPDFLATLLPYYAFDTTTMPLAYLAVKMNRLNAIPLLASFNINVNRLAENQCTALCLAVKKAWLPAVVALLRAGADPTVGKISALTKATETNNSETMDAIFTESWAIYRAELLVRSGAKDNYPLMRMLMKAPDCINYRDRRGRTPLFRLVMEGSKGAVKLLLAFGADPTILSFSGVSPLHVAIQKRRSTVAQLLIAHGADVNAATRDGVTPLHVAAVVGKVKAVDILDSHGASYTIRTTQGQTPADLAVAQGKASMAAYLIKKRIEQQRCAISLGSVMFGRDAVVGQPFVCTASPLYDASKSAQPSPPSAPTGKDLCVAASTENVAAEPEEDDVESDCPGVVEEQFDSDPEADEDEEAMEEKTIVEDDGEGGLTLAIPLDFCVLETEAGAGAGDEAEEDDEAEPDAAMVTEDTEPSADMISDPECHAVPDPEIERGITELEFEEPWTVSVGAVLA